MAIKVRIYWDVPLQSYVMNTQWDKNKTQSFIDVVKLHVPSGSRDFEPSSKTWYFKENFGEFVRQLAESTFGIGTVSFTSKIATEQAQARSSQQYAPTVSGATSQQIILSQFMELLPYEAAKRAYLMACQVLHPDKSNGNSEKMSKLNAVWERIEKEVYRR